MVRKVRSWQTKPSNLTSRKLRLKTLPVQIWLSMTIKQKWMRPAWQLCLRISRNTTWRWLRQIRRPLTWQLSLSKKQQLMAKRFIRWLQWRTIWCNGTPKITLRKLIATTLRNQSLVKLMFTMILVSWSMPFRLIHQVSLDLVKAWVLATSFQMASHTLPQNLPVSWLVMVTNALPSMI